MSVGILCDVCREAVPEFTLPAGFRDDNSAAVLQVSIVRGNQSLDYCRRCFCNFLVQLANVSAPDGFSYYEKNENLVEEK